MQLSSYASHQTHLGLSCSSRSKKQQGCSNGLQYETQCALICRALFVSPVNIFDVNARLRLFDYLCAESYLRVCSYMYSIFENLGSFVDRMHCLFTCGKGRKAGAPQGTSQPATAILKISTASGAPAAPAAPAAPKAQRARRAFPFEESFLDVWEMRGYLDKQLGDDSYSLEVDHCTSLLKFCPTTDKF